MDTNILRKAYPEGSAPSDEMVETHYASLERAACPFCYDGWVYMGYEGVDEDGEHEEVIERVTCRCCRPAGARYEGMIHYLFEKVASREGVGPQPAFPLDLGSLPTLPY